jgi:hypothetical protein
MRLRLTTISGLSLGLMLCGLYLAFAQSEAFLGKRVFFTIVGIMGLFIGNKLAELERRLAELEDRQTPARAVEAAAATRIEA